MEAKHHLEKIGISVPPYLYSSTKGEIRLFVDKLFWINTEGRNASLYTQWWGEDALGVELKVSTSPEEQTSTTAYFPCTVTPDVLSIYLKDQQTENGGFQLHVLDTSKNTIGKAYIDLQNLSPESSIQGLYPVLTLHGEVIAKIRASISFCRKDEEAGTPAQITDQREQPENSCRSESVSSTSSVGARRSETQGPHTSVGVTVDRRKISSSPEIQKQIQQLQQLTMKQLEQMQQLQHIHHSPNDQLGEVTRQGLYNANAAHSLLNDILQFSDGKNSSPQKPTPPSSVNEHYPMSNRCHTPTSMAPSSRGTRNTPRPAPTAAIPATPPQGLSRGPTLDETSNHLQLVPAGNKSSVIVPSKTLNIHVEKALHVTLVSNQEDFSQAYPPSCFVAWEVRGQDKNGHMVILNDASKCVTQCIPYSTSPVWGSTLSLSVGTGYLIDSLICNLWHQPDHSSGHGEMQAQLLGASCIDLTALRKGLETLEGWYHIHSTHDPSNSNSIGQLKVGVHIDDATYSRTRKSSAEYKYRMPSPKRSETTSAILNELNNLDKALTNPTPSARQAEEGTTQGSFSIHQPLPREYREYENTENTRIPRNESFVDEKKPPEAQEGRTQDSHRFVDEFDFSALSPSELQNRLKSSMRELDMIQQSLLTKTSSNAGNAIRNVMHEMYTPHTDLSAHARGSSFSRSETADVDVKYTTPDERGVSIAISPAQNAISPTFQYNSAYAEASQAIDNLKTHSRPFSCTTLSAILPRAEIQHRHGNAYAIAHGTSASRRMEFPPRTFEKPQPPLSTTRTLGIPPRALPSHISPLSTNNDRSFESSVLKDLRHQVTGSLIDHHNSPLRSTSFNLRIESPIKSRETERREQPKEEGPARQSHQEYIQQVKQLLQKHVEVQKMKESA